MAVPAPLSQLPATAVVERTHVHPVAWGTQQVPTRHRAPRSAICRMEHGVLCHGSGDAQVWSGGWVVCHLVGMVCPLVGAAGPSVGVICPLVGVVCLPVGAVWQLLWFVHQLGWLVHRLGWSVHWLEWLVHRWDWLVHQLGCFIHWLEWFVLQLSWFVLWLSWLGCAFSCSPSCSVCARASEHITTQMLCSVLAPS